MGSSNLAAVSGQPSYPIFASYVIGTINNRLTQTQRVFHQHRVEVEEQLKEHIRLATVAKKPPVPQVGPVTISSPQ